MRINRVVLKNYRSHVATEVVFDKGINLILGPNGAGKSSIIEAVGVALFDADARSSRTDAVRQGAKTAIIEVAFEANDGLEYVVEKRIGATNISKLRCEGDDAARVEGKEAVLSKVRQLTGLELNEKNLFQNVITAYQNKFVAIFTETPSRREELFNQIFDTAIYREMFDGYAKEATDGYRHKLDTIVDAKQRLESKRRDVALLKIQTGEQAEAVKRFQDKMDLVGKELTECQLKLSNFEQVRASAQSTEATLKHKRELLATRVEEGQKAKTQVVECEDAQQKMGKHARGHKRYCELDEKLGEIGKRIEDLEVLEKKVNVCRDERNALVSEKSGLVERIEHVRSGMEQARLEQKETACLIETSQEEKEKNIRKQDDVKALGVKAREQFDEIKRLVHSWEEQLSGLKQLSERIEQCATSPESISAIEEKLARVKEKKDEYEEESKSRLKLQQNKTLLESRIKDNIKAKQTLGQKMCPILHEPCSNVSHKNSVEDYFVQKDDLLRRELAQIDSQLIRYADLDGRISANETLLGRLMHQLEEEKKKHQLKEVMLKDKCIAQKDIEILKSAIDKHILALPEEIKKEYKETDDIELVISVLGENVSDLRAQFVQCKAMVDNDEKELRKLRTQRDKISDKLERFERLVKETERQLLAVTENIQSKEALIERDQDVLKRLPLLREERKKYQTEAAAFKHDYDTYVAFGQKASELEQALAYVKHIEAEIKRLTKEEEELRAIYLQHMSRWDESEYTALKKRIDDKNRENVSLQQQLSDAATALALARRDLQDALAIEKELKELDGEAAILERKLWVSQQFRSNLSGMGKYIASRLINRVEVLATEHFRSITGRPESVRWVNDEKNAYAVYLHKHKTEEARSFEILSGGEQVAVALAVRSAMAGLLTSANIALFDEPTINLDSERKTALAESLRSMLKDLDQAIIVTHDDVFREMAQKTITL